MNRHPIRRSSRNAQCRVTAVALLISSFAIFAATPDNGTPGKIDGVKTWTMQTTDNGLQPTQCWHSVGSTPDGDIYASGSDHATNSALYSVRMSDDKLYYVGDARAASTAANNLTPNEPIQKFHTRPTYHNGRVYVANMNASEDDDAYLAVRGFHWYGYDVAQTTLIDLSASEPNGVAAEHGGIVTLAIDHDLNRIYGAMEPLGNVYLYDIAQKKTTDLGRWPTINQPYVYCNRVMWIDSRHRLWTSGGAAVNPTFKQPDDTAVFRHLHYYDPTTGWGENRNLRLVFGDAIETGQWSRDRKHFYCSDDQGNLYRFDDEGPAFTSLGKLDLGGRGYLWVFDLSADEKKIYAVPSDGPNALIEYDIAAKTQRTLCANGDLSTPTGSQPRHTGYNAWDANGCFYYTTFANTALVNVVLTRVDPVRLKVARGLLPALVTVSMQLTTDKTGVQVTRSGGATTAALDVMYDVKQAGKSYNESSTLVGTVTIPAAQSSVTVPLAQLAMPDSVRAKGFTVSVVPNGNDYVAATQRSATVGSSVVVSRPIKGVNRGAASRIRFERAGSMVRIVVPASLKGADIALYDCAGRILLRSLVSAESQTVIKPHATGGGVYVLRISSQSGMVTQETPVGGL